MNKIKYALLLGLALGCAVATQAQTMLSGVTVANTVKQVVTNGAAVFYLQIIDTSGTNNVVHLFDNSGASTNRVFGAYTAILSYPTNQIVGFTNMAGVVVSYTNAIQFTSIATVAAVTNLARVVNSINVPASGSVTWLPTSPQGVTFGVQLLSLYPTSYNIQYLKLP